VVDDKDNLYPQKDALQVQTQEGSEEQTKKEPDEETNIDINEIIQKMFGNCPVDDEDGDDDDVETLLGDIIPPDDFNGGDW
jgi:hypothetical protein